ISYPKNRINVLLLENVHPRAEELFKREGYNVESYKHSFSRDELKELIKNTTILGIRSKTLIDAELLDNANRLMTIGAFCIGTDQINLAESAEKGVAVFNAPYSNTRSVVELAIGEIIMLIRSVFEKSNKLHQGTWDKSCHGNYEVRGKKLGIIGYGNIGSQLSILAEAIGMEVYYYDIVDKLPLGNARKCDSMKQLLRKVDIVSIHVSGELNNFHLIGEKEFQMMKKGVVFLNLSRGFVVDLAALVKYLQNSKIYGAAIDVFEKEPKSNSEQFICELQKLPNVILTPHIGGSTVEAQRNIAEFVPGKIIDYINSGNSILSVNFPNIQLPELHKVHRLIHIHKNIPGMLAQINSVLGKYNINIEGQYLKTTKEIGYAITDISKGNHQELIRDLRMIPNTIKFRILY
ncbi:phosphoglycerate dehydrogenase, partial [candidate division KSB1 bacterium]|nr:phosphoglycerate dehydrogenase [candidate division KSB1 bacterium]